MNPEAKELLEDVLAAARALTGLRMGVVVRMELWNDLTEVMNKYDDFLAKRTYSVALYGGSIANVPQDMVARYVNLENLPTGRNLS